MVIRKGKFSGLLVIVHSSGQAISDLNIILDVGEEICEVARQMACVWVG